MPVFIDTNIVVYADDAAHPKKQRIAATLIADAYRSGQGVISTQVMQEYYLAAVNKLGIDPAVAVERLRFFTGFEVVQATPEIVLRATDLHRLHPLSFCDALILQAAVTSGCDTLWSEDLQHGGVIAGVKVLNPFLPPKGKPGAAA